MDVCIIGTGYVGLVAAACLSETGNNVTCIDSNPTIVDALNSGSVHIFEPGLEAMVMYIVSMRLMETRSGMLISTMLRPVLPW